MYENNAKSSLGTQSQANRIDDPKPAGDLGGIHARLEQAVQGMNNLRGRLRAVQDRLYGETLSTDKTQAPRPVPNGRVEALRAEMNDLENALADCHGIADVLMGVA
jgi:hypothetical protein